MLIVSCGPGLAQVAGGGGMQTKSPAVQNTGKTQPVCKCTKLPYTPDPPCVEQCVAMIAAAAKAQDLKHVFDLNPQETEALAKTQGAVKRAHTGEEAVSVLKRGIGTESFSKITDQVKNLDGGKKYEWDELAKEFNLGRDDSKHPMVAAPGGKK